MKNLPSVNIINDKVKKITKNVKAVPVEEVKKVVAYEKAVLKTISEDEWNKWSVIKEKKKT
jgi:hypothetical protein